MSLIKQFELAGVGSDVQFGKNGNKLKSAAGAMSLYLADDSTLANLFVAAPTADQHAATKLYVDNAIQGLNVKQACLVATTADIALDNTTTTVDGVTLTTGDRVLVKNQTDATENGIYIASTIGAWSRSADANIGSELEAAFVFVEEGTANDNTGWVVTTDPPIVIGSSNIYWSQFSGAGSYLAGSGLTLTGNTFSANVDGVTTYIDGSNNVAVKSSGTQYQTLISNGLGTTPSWGAVNLSQSAAITGTLPVTNGGTGASSFTSHGVLLGNGSSTLNVTAAGTTGQVLVATTGSDPAFSNINLASSAAVGSTILGLANGGTNAALTAAAGAVAYSTASAIALTAAGTSGQILQSNGTSAPSFVDVTDVAVVDGTNIGTGPGEVFKQNNAGTLEFRTLIAGSPKIVINTDTVASDTVGVDVVESALTLNNIGGTLSVTKGGTGNSTIAADQIFYGNGANTMTTTTLTSFARNLLDDVDAASARITLGLVIGTDVQAWDAGLDALAAFNTNGFLVQTSEDTFVGRSITVAGAGALAGLAITNGDAVAANPQLGLDIQNLASGSLTNTCLFPIFDGTNNVTVTSDDIGDTLVQSDFIDPLTVQGLNLGNNHALGNQVFGANPIGSYGSAAWYQALVTRVVVYVDTPFDAGVDVAVYDGNGNLLADSSAIDLQTPGTYVITLNGLPASFGGFNSKSNSDCYLTWSGVQDTSGSLLQVAMTYNLTM